MDRPGRKPDKVNWSINRILQVSALPLIFTHDRGEKLTDHIKLYTGLTAYVYWVLIEIQVAEVRLLSVLNENRF